MRERLAALAEQAGLDPLRIVENPRTPESEAIFWGNLGITYGEMGQYEEQLRLLRKSITLTPDNPQRLETLGNALGKVAQVEQHAAEEAVKQRDHAGAQRLEVQARAHREESVRIYQEAEALLTPEQLARYPHLANSIPYNLGATLGDLGRYAEAVAARQRALASDPNDAMSYRGLAIIYFRRAEEAGISLAARVEHLEQAEANMRQVLVIAPNYVNGQALLATIQRELAAARHDVKPTE